MWSVTHLVCRLRSNQPMRWGSPPSSSGGRREWCAALIREHPSPPSDPQRRRFAPSSRVSLSVLLYAGKVKGSSGYRRASRACSLLILLLAATAVWGQARAYVTSSSSDDASVIDISTNTVIDTIALGSLPYGVAVGTTHAYVANLNSNNVTDV